MSKLQQRKDLSTKAIKLINEYIDEASIICENYISDIKTNDGFDAITFTDETDEVNEYSLTNASGIFRDEMEGLGPCGASFYEGVNMAISELEYDYKNYNSKEEYIQYAGSLFYMKARCEEIYEELKKIDKEAKLLID